MRNTGILFLQRFWPTFFFFFFFAASWPIFFIWQKQTKKQNKNKTKQKKKKKKKKKAKNWARRVGLCGKSESTYLCVQVCETNSFFP